MPNIGLSSVHSVDDVQRLSSKQRIVCVQLEDDGVLWAVVSNGVVLVGQRAFPHFVFDEDDAVDQLRVLFLAFLNELVRSVIRGIVDHHNHEVGVVLHLQGPEERAALWFGLEVEKGRHHADGLLDDCRAEVVEFVVVVVLLLEGFLLSGSSFIDLRDQNFVQKSRNLKSNWFIKLPILLLSTT